MNAGGSRHTSPNLRPSRRSSAMASKASPSMPSASSTPPTSLIPYARPLALTFSTASSTAGREASTSVTEAAPARAAVAPKLPT